MLIEKTVSLAVFVAVVVESAGVLVWAGAASQRLQALEGRVAAQAAMIERMARVEVKLEDAAGQLARIEKSWTD